MQNANLQEISNFCAISTVGFPTGCEVNAPFGVG